MKVIVINCRSIRNKVAAFEVLISSIDPDIVIATESRLTPDVRNSEILPSAYSIFRRDRQGHGGGVFIMTRKEMICSEVELPKPCEMVAVDIELKGQQNVKVVAFYRPLKVTMSTWKILLPT